MPTSRPIRRAAGFSFIEILVVMGIIATLAGLGVIIINIWVRRGPESQTKDTVQRVKALVDQWKQRFQDFPPMSLQRLDKIAGTAPVKGTLNEVNAPVEALYQALFLDGFSGSADLNASQTGNTDDDYLTQKVTSRGLALSEIIDAYGNPLVYFVNTDYVKALNNPPSYQLKNGDTVEPKPYQEPGGGFVNPNGFQVFSMGPDGKPNTDDDILGW